MSRQNWLFCKLYGFLLLQATVEWDSVLPFKLYRPIFSWLMQLCLIWWFFYIWKKNLLFIVCKIHLIWAPLQLLDEVDYATCGNCDYFTNGTHPGNFSWLKGTMMNLSWYINASNDRNVDSFLKSDYFTELSMTMPAFSMHLDPWRHLAAMFNEVNHYFRTSDIVQELPSVAAVGFIQQYRVEKDCASWK